MVRPAHALLAGIVAAAVVAGYVIISAADGYDGHKLTATIPEATSVGAGQAIRLGGVKVGEVKSIDPADHGRAARIQIIFSDKVWPLAKSSTLALRWAGTVQANNRYIALTPGTGGPVYAAGDQFDAKRFSVPVEFDQLLGTFNRGVRDDLNDFLRQGGASFSKARGALGRALEHSPPALDQASKVLSDVADQQASLQTLITSGDRVLAAVNASNPDVKSLLQGAGTTFDAIADEDTSLQQALSQAPATFTNVRDTLHRADSTLGLARDVTGKLASGVTEVRRTAQPLVDVLGTVRRVGPDAVSTLQALRTAAPDLTALLGRVRTLSPDLGSIGDQSVQALRCIRPYSPEILSFFTLWGDYTSHTDGKDKLFRAQVQNYGPAFSNVATYTPGEAAKLFPGLTYGFPRPPGEMAGQPWFLPKCGAGPDALDPDKDTEAGGYQGQIPPPLEPGK
jgi:ABC-type transporter Mla subunit MlaD